MGLPLNTMLSTDMFSNRSSWILSPSPTIRKSMAFIPEMDFPATSTSMSRW